MANKLKNELLIKDLKKLVIYSRNQFYTSSMNKDNCKIFIKINSSKKRFLSENNFYKN